jgi:ankyrin repeat protein
MYRAVNRELLQRLSSIVPWGRLNTPSSLQSSSKTAAALTILMPEQFKGQHQSLSSRLSSSRNSGKDLLAVELFLLSNNLIPHASEAGEGRSTWGMRSEDERVMKMLKDSGWGDSKHLRVLLATREPSAEAIAEKVFASSLRLQDLETVKMMLEAQMNPNGKIEIVEHGMLAPLEFAASLADDDGAELIDLLLAHGADVNPSNDEYPPLFYAIQARNTICMDKLLRQHAVVTPTCLSAATRLKTFKAFQEIVDSCSDVNARAGLQGHTALAAAVQVGDVSKIQLLLAKGAKTDELIAIEFEHDTTTTTILGLGVQTEKLEVVQSLLDRGVDINPDFNGFPFISPLTLAVETGRTDIVMSLLQKGMDVKAIDEGSDKTLLERAARKKNLSLCEALLAHGAKLNDENATSANESSALLVALMGGSTEIVELFVATYARLNDHYTKPPGSVLGAAIEMGDMASIHILLTAGARLIGAKIRKIGNLETAQFLQGNGVLRNLLLVSGSKILVAAITDGKLDLAQYLLDHDAHLGDLGRENNSSEEESPLEAAIEYNHIQFAEVLLNRGAKVTDGAIAGTFGTSFFDAELQRRLLADFHGSAPSAIGAAILFEYPLGLFREANIDPKGTPKLDSSFFRLEDFDFNIPSPESVLELGVLMGNKEDLISLLEWVPWSATLVGRALTLAILLGEQQLLDLLMRFGPDVTQEIKIDYHDSDEFEMETGNRGIYTPLQAAVKHQYVEVATELAKSADVNYLGNGARRRTPLQHAVENGNMELVNMLLKHGARVDGAPAEDGGATALQIASLRGYIGIAQRLLDLGADVNESPAKRNGRTALQGAAEYGRIDMLHMLLDKGPLVVGDAERHYHKAVDLAERNGHMAAARILRHFRSTVEPSLS